MPNLFLKARISHFYPQFWIAGNKSLCGGLLTASAEDTATEDATEKYGRNERDEKEVETYAEKAKVSAAGVKTAEMYRAGASANTTSASNTIRTTF